MKIKTHKRQSFHFTAPDANSVLLVGDFTQWQEKPIPMYREKSGVWAATADIPPGEHRYRFLVDGEWRDDPECTIRVPNPYGSEDMVTHVA
jgi:1,4-alpha-glucan branching enzyme